MHDIERSLLNMSIKRMNGMWLHKSFVYLKFISAYSKCKISDLIPNYNYFFYTLKNVQNFLKGSTYQVGKWVIQLLEYVRIEPSFPIFFLLPSNS